MRGKDQSTMTLFIYSVCQLLINWPLSKGYFQLAIETGFSGCCHCGEVKIRVNVWTVCRNWKKWPLQKGGCCSEVAIGGGKTVFQVFWSLKLIAKKIPYLPWLPTEDDHHSAWAWVACEKKKGYHTDQHFLLTIFVKQVFQPKQMFWCDSFTYL